jgi:hypothetical protein
MTKPKIFAMHEHVIAMCRDKDITVSWCDRPTQAIAMRECDEIRIPRIKSPMSYATALHEIGHLCGRYQQSKTTLVRERWPAMPNGERASAPSETPRSSGT